MNPAPPTFRATMMDLNRPEPALIPREPRMLQRILPSLIRPRTLDFSMVESLVAAAFGLPADVLHGRSRIGPHAWARQVAYYLIADFTHATHCQIAQWFSRDHSTITHGIKHVTDLLDVYPELKRELDALRLEINQRIAEAA